MSHHYDRPWSASEPRDGRLVVIGQKGLDRARHRAGAHRIGHASPRLLVHEPRRDRRAGRPRPAAGRYRGAVVCGQRSIRARGGVGGRAGYAAKRATCTSARPSPPTLDRSLDRQGRHLRQGDFGPPARRARLVALRDRSARRPGACTRNHTRGAPRRGPRRPAACRSLDTAGVRSRGLAGILPRGRTRQPACPPTPACRIRWCRCASLTRRGPFHDLRRICRVAARSISIN